MSGLLDGVLPWIFSQGDTMKRNLRGNVRSLLEDPRGYAQSIGQDIAAENARKSQAAKALLYPSVMDEQGQQQAMQAMTETALNLLAPTVYHGSPYKFDKFDSSKIGTGEGAQAYGHGLYFAESPKVAGAYQKQLTSGARGWEYDGKLADSLPMEQRNLIESFLDKTKYKGMPEAEALAALKADAVSGLAQAEKNLQEARANLGKTLDMGKEWGNLQFFTYGPEHIASAEKSLEQMRRHLAEVEKLKPGAIKANEGALYKVDLPDDMAAKMLDWDKPLSQQPESVRQALESAPGWPFVKQFIDRDFTRNVPAGVKPNGQALSEILSNRFGGQDKAAEYLQSIGIPGIRYLDAGSRGGNFDQWIVTSPSGMARQFATEEEAKKAAAYVGGTIIAPKASYNYVVFPGGESQLKILERNGKGLLDR